MTRSNSIERLMTTPARRHPKKYPQAAGEHGTTHHGADCSRKQAREGEKETTKKKRTKALRSRHNNKQPPWPKLPGVERPCVLHLKLSAVRVRRKACVYHTKDSTTCSLPHHTATRTVLPAAERPPAARENCLGLMILMQQRHRR